MAKYFSSAFLCVGLAVLLLGPPLNVARAGGALAIGLCAAYGHSYDFPDLSEAQATALAKCSEKSCTLPLP